MKKFLSLVLALVMTMSLVTISAGAKDFTDDSKINYDEAVDVISAVKVVDGYTDGSFNPQATLTRGAAAKIICNMILGPTTAGALVADSAPFKDVPANHTFAGYIAYCAKEGIISGYADGTFKPGNTLTGYAFMKMLLGALGYDKTTEGYEGANWSINVAKRALNVGLDDGLTGDFNGTKPVTREEACLYAFNTLNAETVKYEGGNSVTVNGITFTNGGQLKEDQGLFREKYFTKLDADDDADVYGRPATKWTNDKKEIGTYGKDADAVYTTDAKLYTLRTDLKVNSSSDNMNFYYTINGESVFDDAGTAITVASLNTYNSTSDTKLSAVDVVGTYVGNGVTVEVFYDDEKAADSKFVVIDEFLSSVDEVDTDDDGRFVMIDGNKFYTKEFDVDDDVLYTVGNGDNVIASVTAAEKLTGKLTRIQNGKYTIDGTVYELHGGYTGASVDVTASNINDEVEFYLDSNGYIIKIKAVSASSAVENLVLFTQLGNSGFDKIAKAIYATGKTETVTLKDATTSTNHIYSFTTSSGKIKVSENASYTSAYDEAAYYFTKGTTVIKDALNNAVIKVNGKTNFVLVDTNGDAKAYVGYKNAPSVLGNGATAMATYSKDGVASVVYLWTAGAAVSSSNKDLTYLIADTYDLVEEKNANGDSISYYEVRTLDKNVVVRVDEDTMAAIAAKADMGVMVYESMTKDDNGIVYAAVQKSDTKIAYNTLGDGTKVEEDGDVLYFNGGDGVAYADDMVVYFIAANGDSFTTGKVSSISDIAGKYAGYTYVTNTDGEITTLVLKRA